MNWIGEVLRRLHFRLRGSRFDRDLAEEMRLHVDLRTADRVSGGMSVEEADAAARQQFGNTTLVHESSREAWGWTFMDRLRQDLQYATRSLLSQPGFTATAVLSLVLGIGANTAIFSIVNAVMLRSLPVEDPQALVQVKLGAGGDGELNTPLWEQIRDHQTAFSGVLAYSQERFNLADAGEVRPAQGLYVSGDFFRVLGVPAAVGRTFTPADDQWGGGPDGLVAVVSHRFWQSHMKGDPEAIGKRVRLNRQSFAVVGVTPAWFTGLDIERAYDVAIPIGSHAVLHTELQRAEHTFYWWLRILGRIAPGSTVALAEEKMRAIAPQLFRAALPPGRDARERAEQAKTSFVLTPAGLGFSQTRIQYRSALFALMSIAGVVLLIACANIANLLSARGAARQRELSVRLAIGASRIRVVRQLMTESLLIAAIGATGGLAVAVWGSRTLLTLLSSHQTPIDISTALDWRVLAFTTAAAVFTAILFGLVPSVRSTRLGLNTVLKENQRALQGGRRFLSTKLLVGGQIALSMLLLVAAGLFAGTLRNLLTSDPGFDRRNITLMNVDLPQNTTAEQRLETFRQILNTVRSVPGVVSAAHSVLTPISPQGWAEPSKPEGFIAKSPRDTVLFLNSVSAGYFRTMRTPILMGREFDDRETPTSARVMLINESAARAFFGSENPIGKTIAFDRRRAKGERDVYQVIGVVKDTKYNRLNEQQRRIGYFSSEHELAPALSLRYAILSDLTPESLIASLRSTVSTVNRDAALEFRSLDAQVKESLLQPRLVAVLSTVFGGLALLLAMVGLYGSTMYSVTQRRGEIGVRMAMGAQRGSVIWLMMRDVITVLVIGMAAGLAASLALGRLVASMLFGLRFNDPEPLVLAVAILVLCATVAAFLPAAKAARLDPMTALREE